jgi:hypothetical protein
MNNPVTLMIWLNVNGLYQSLRFSKTMMDAFFPRPRPAAEATPRSTATEAGLGRGRCLGPADLRG